MFIPFIEEKKGNLTVKVRVNVYRHKIGLQNSPDCNCGEIETVAHYICECEEYEMERQKLLTQLFYQTGEQDKRRTWT